MDETDRDELEVDATRGFIAAACAPALVAAGFGLIGGPFAIVIFVLALAIAGLHVALLAAPLYALLSLWREPGPAIVLPASVLIGGLPVPLLFGWPFVPGVPIGSIFGLIGGIAFLAWSRREGMDEGY